MIRMLWHNLKSHVYWCLKRAELQSRYGLIIEDTAGIKFPENIQLSKNVKIGYGAFIHCGQKRLSAERRNVVIGENSYIGSGSILFGEAGIEIGDNCGLGPGVVLTSLAFTLSRIDIPMVDQPAEAMTIILEDDVCVGSNAVILPGVRVGKGSAIGAGAVVTKDIPPYSVAVGVPAKVIKNRGEKNGGK